VRDGAVGVGTRPDDAQDIAPIEFRFRQHRNLHADGPASQARRIDAAREFMRRQFAQRPTVEVLPGNHHVDGLGRNVQQLAVLDLQAARQPADDEITAAEIAATPRPQHGSAHFDDLLPRRIAR
jgi:hypothetical protein